MFRLRAYAPSMFRLCRTKSSWLQGLWKKGSQPGLVPDARVRMPVLQRFIPGHHGHPGQGLQPRLHLRPRRLQCSSGLAAAYSPHQHTVRCAKCIPACARTKRARAAPEQLTEEAHLAVNKEVEGHDADGLVVVNPELYLPVAV